MTESNQPPGESVETIPVIHSDPVVLTELGTRTLFDLFDNVKSLRKDLDDFKKTIENRLEEFKRSLDADKATIIQSLNETKEAGHENRKNLSNWLLGIAVFLFAVLGISSYYLTTQFIALNREAATNNEAISNLKQQQGATGSNPGASGSSSATSAPQPAPQSKPNP